KSIRHAADKSHENTVQIHLARVNSPKSFDLTPAEIDYHLIHELPVELMVRHSFVPLIQEGNVLFVVMADPTNLDAIDELEAQLHVKLKVAVGAKSAVKEALKRGDTAARILQDATAGFRTDRMSLVVETEHGEEDLD